MLSKFITSLLSIHVITSFTWIPNNHHHHYHKSFFVARNKNILLFGLNNERTSDSSFSSDSISEAFEASAKFQESRKQEYAIHIHYLHKLMTDAAERFKEMEELTQSLMDLELDDPKVTKLREIPPNVALAISEAKKADVLFGTHSNESKVAWDYAETVSSGGEVPITTTDNNNNNVEKTNKTYRYSQAALSAHHSLDAIVDAQTLNDTLEAFGRIEHMTRLLEMEKKRLSEILAP